MNKSLGIHDVTDTAIWVAVYRAQESNRPLGLFRDECANLLVSKEDFKIASYTQGSRYTAWSVVIRTCIIDQFIKDIIDSNPLIDTVLNLGAGLDTRPYRFDYNRPINWIEVDFLNVIQFKNEKLKMETPKVALKRIAFDLSNTDELKSFLNEVVTISKNILVLTEGVMPYLTNHEVKTFAETLYSFDKIKYWITEYYSPEILEYLRTPKRQMQMKEAPFKFYPDDWFGFYSDCGFELNKILYFGDESIRLKRTPPLPGFIKKTISENKKADNNEINSIHNYLGYGILNRK